MPRPATEPSIPTCVAFIQFVTFSRRTPVARGSPGSEVTPSVPITARAIAVSNDIEAVSQAAITDTTEGPTMKLISSFTDSNACQRVRSDRLAIWVQRTRVRAPTFGTAIPAATASDTMTHGAATNPIATSRPMEAPTKAASRALAMSRWP